VTRLRLLAIGGAVGATAAVGLRVWQAARRRRLAALTKAELYERAKQAEVPGRSTMTKDELADALKRVV
jgi:DNA end-binding protein Ku